MSRRTDRINGLLRQEISRLLSRELNDPRLSGVVSITRVETSSDLRISRVYVSVLGGSDDKDAVLKGALAGHAPGEVIETCTILTTAANEAVAPIHHRMPVILRPEHFDPWLAGEAVALAPYPPESMRVQPVSTRVNTPSNDDPRCIEPVEDP